jgi:hypothetical protein
VVLLPGLVAGLTAGATSGVIPDYPLIASSTFPAAPDQRVELGSIVLDANSADGTTTGRTTNGLNQATATVTKDPSSGTVTARSETAAGRIRLSNLLTLDGVRSTAVAQQDEEGHLTLSSSFTFGALDVNGQRITLSDLLRVRSQHLDLGATAAKLLLDQLAGEGTSIDVVPQEKTKDSVTSAGLRIRLVTPAPDLPSLPSLPDTGLSSVPALSAILALPGGVSGLKSVVTEVVIGQATARIDGRTLPPPPSEGSEAGGGVPPLLGTPEAPPAFLAPTPITPAPSAAPEPPALGPDRSLAIADLRSTPFYAALVLVGLLCASAFVLIGKLGVREP